MGNSSSSWGGSMGWCSAFTLTDEEKSDTREKLAGRLYLVTPVRKYVLLRLDDLLAKQPGVSYQHKMITGERRPSAKPSRTTVPADGTSPKTSAWSGRTVSEIWSS